PVPLLPRPSCKLTLTKSMSHGYYLYSAYTFSKNIANATDVANGGGGGGIQNTYARSMDKAVVGSDRTHVLKAAINWEAPFGKGRALLRNAHPVLNALVGGWTVS